MAQNVRNKVFIIDDDPDILFALKLMLEDEGYIVSTTEKGDQVIMKVEKDLPNLIILDMLLSGKDGKDICMDLKKFPNTKCIPVLMMSAHPSAQVSAMKAGADDFLAKPFNINVLLDKVAKNIRSI